MTSLPGVPKSVRPEIILLVGLFSLIVALLPAPVHAASVTVPVDVTVAEAGAPSFTWTIIGSCSQSPSTGSTGATVTVTMDSSCNYSIVVPNDGATQRDRLTTGTGAYTAGLPETSCASGACPDVTDTAHVQEFLTYSATTCVSAMPSPASPTGDLWYNYGTSVTLTCNGVWGRVNGAGTRATSWNWNGGANNDVATVSTFTSSSVSMTAGNTFNVNTMSQYQLTLDSGAIRALETITGPTITGDNYWYDTGTAVTYTGYGVLARVSGAGNRSASWSLDSGSAIPLSTSNSFTASATMNSAHILHVNVVKQYQVTLSGLAYSILNSITPPTLANDNSWYDSGTAVTVNLNGIVARSAGVGTRLGSYTINGGTPIPAASATTVAVLNKVAIASPEMIDVSTVTQYQMTLDLGATSAISSATPTPITGDNYWYDAGTQVTYMGNGVYGRAQGSGLRITGWWWDSGSSTPVLTIATFPASIVMNAPHVLHTTGAVQYQVSLSGTYVVASSSPPTLAGDGYWYDSGTSVSFSLQGVFGRTAGTGERLTSYSVNGGAAVPVLASGIVKALNSLVITSPVKLSAQVVTQYEVAFQGATAAAMVSVTQPTVAGDNYWYDVGSGVKLVLNGVWARNSTAGFRLTSYSVDGALPTSVATTGPITLDLGQVLFPRTVSSKSVMQYTLTVNGGAGISYSKSPPIPKDAGWYDAGTSLNVSTRATFGSNGTVRQMISSWSLDGGPSNQAGMEDPVTVTVVMNVPRTLTFNSAVQYLVTITLKDSGGAVTLSQGAITVNVNGGSETAEEGAVWVYDGASVQVVSVNWKGVEVAPVQAPTYKVSAPLSITVPVRAYEAQVVVKDLLGISVGGAQYTITLANQTTLKGTTAGDGVIHLGVVPLGTFDGTVSYLGTSSTFSADASVSPTTSVVMYVSYPLIALAIGLVVLAVAIVFYRFRRTRSIT